MESGRQQGRYLDASPSLAGLRQALGRGGGGRLGADRARAGRERVQSLLLDGAAGPGPDPGDDGGAGPLVPPHASASGARDRGAAGAEPSAEARRTLSRSIRRKVEGTKSGDRQRVGEGKKGD